MEVVNCVRAVRAIRNSFVCSVREEAATDENASRGVEDKVNEVFVDC